MARTFSPLSITLPLRTTWEESWQLLQSESGPPVDLTGYKARMFLKQYEDGEPVVGAAAVTFLSTGVAPKLTVTPLDGRIDLKVAAVDVAALSSDNVTRTFAFEVELFVPAGLEPEYVVPLFKGFATARARVELLA